MSAQASQRNKGTFIPHYQTRLYHSRKGMGHPRPRASRRITHRRTADFTVGTQSI